MKKAVSQKVIRPDRLKSTMATIFQQNNQGPWYFRPGSPLRAYLARKKPASNFSIGRQTCPHKILQVLRDIISEERLYDDRNASIVLCDQALEIALDVRACHLPELTDIVLLQLTKVSSSLGEEEVGKMLETPAGRAANYRRIVERALDYSSHFEVIFKALLQDALKSGIEHLICLCMRVITEANKSFQGASTLPYAAGDFRIRVLRVLSACTRSRMEEARGSRGELQASLAQQEGADTRDPFTSEKGRNPQDEKAEEDSQGEKEKEEEEQRAAKEEETLPIEEIKRTEDFTSWAQKVLNRIPGLKNKDAQEESPWMIKKVSDLVIETCCRAVTLRHSAARVTEAQAISPQGGLPRAIFHEGDPNIPQDQGDQQEQTDYASSSSSEGEESSAREEERPPSAAGVQSSAPPSAGRGLSPVATGQASAPLSAVRQPPPTGQVQTSTPSSTVRSSAPVRSGPDLATAPITPHTRFRVLPAFRVVLGLVPGVPADKEIFTFDELTRALSHYILDNRMRFFDDRNIKVALVDGDPLGVAFRVRAFHRTQVTSLLRSQLVWLPEELARLPPVQESITTQPSLSLLNRGVAPDIPAPQSRPTANPSGTPAASASQARSEANSVAPQASAAPATQARPLNGNTTPDPSYHTEYEVDSDQDAAEEEWRQGLNRQDSSDDSIVRDVVLSDKGDQAGCSFTSASVHPEESDSEEETKGEPGKQKCVECGSTQALANRCSDCWLRKKEATPRRRKPRKRRRSTLRRKEDEEKKQKREAEPQKPVEPVAGPSGQGQEKKKEEVDLCDICFSRPKDAGLVHGQITHQVSCYPCAKKTFKRKGVCPLCRRKIEKITRIFS